MSADASLNAEGVARSNGLVKALPLSSWRPGSVSVTHHSQTLPLDDLRVGHPTRQQRQHVDLREVSPAGLARVVDCAPRRTRCIPRPPRRPRTSAAAGVAVSARTGGEFHAKVEALDEGSLRPSLLATVRAVDGVTDVEVERSIQPR